MLHPSDSIYSPDPHNPMKMVVVELKWFSCMDFAYSLLCSSNWNFLNEFTPLLPRYLFKL